MPSVLFVVILFALFALIGAAADLVIKNIRVIAEKTGVRLMYLGLILGIGTSLPELTIGLTAHMQGIGSLSHGNLIGGIIVLISLVLGLALILNRLLKTDGKLGPILPALGLLLLPVALGFDGRIGLIDGVVMVLAYFAAFLHLFNSRHTRRLPHIAFFRERTFLKETLAVLFGLICILIASRFAIDLTLEWMTGTKLPPFAIGLMIYSLGTNLPEIILAIRSFQRGAGELSWSGILGSAMVNPLILGLLAILRPIPVTITSEYLVISFGLLLLVMALGSMYRSDRAFTRKEGVVLVLFFFGIVATERLVSFIGL
jgi:cation:H+ antiporter